MKVSLEPISLIACVLGCLVLVDGRGGSGGGGGVGGRGGGGFGGGSRGGFGRSGSRGLSRTRVGGAAVILGSGAAGYAAYRAHQNAKKDRERGDKENPDFDSFEQYITDADYKLQESTSYYASEGIGMSAWGLIFLILTIIAVGTLGWYCCNVFLPVWQDNRQMRRRSMLGNRMKDEMPLQETPSTATPSP